MRERLQRKWLKAQPIFCGRTCWVENGWGGLSDWHRSAGCATLILPAAVGAGTWSGGRLDNPKGMSILSGASFLMALLQSVCAAVLTISGLRVAIGLTAFALAGSAFAPVRWFHQDAIRIPMLALATVGAVVDLAVLAWMRHLRSRSSAQWRKRDEERQREADRAAAVCAGGIDACACRVGDLDARDCASRASSCGGAGECGCAGIDGLSEFRPSSPVSNSSERPGGPLS